MRHNQGQQIGEYAIMLGVVALAVLSTQTHITRSVYSALRAESQAILGSPDLLDEDATHSDLTTETVRQSGDATFTQTDVSSTSTGTSDAGMILAESHGPLVMAAMDLLTSEEQVLYQLAEKAGLLEEGFDLVEIKREGEGLAGVFKKGDEEKAIGYNVLGSFVFDPVSGLGKAELDVDGDGQMDLLVYAVPQTDLLMVEIDQRLKGLDESKRYWKELMADETLELADEARVRIEAAIKAGDKILAGTDRTALSEASVEELQEIERALNGRDYTFREAAEATVSVLNANKEQFMKEQVSWPLSLDGESDSILQMVDAANDMGKLVEFLEAAPHKEEVKKHLEAAQDYLNQVPWGSQEDDGDDYDGSRTTLGLMAYGELQAAYDLLGKDVEGFLGLGEDDGSEELSGTEILANLPWRPPADEFLQDGRFFDVGLGGAHDSIPEVVLTKDGDVQKFEFVVIEPGQEPHVVTAEEWVAGAYPVVRGMTGAAEPQEVLKGYSGRPPAELIAAVGKGASTFETTNAWIPLSPRAALIGEMAESGAGTTRDFSTATQGTGYEPPIDPKDFQVQPH